MESSSSSSTTLDESSGCIRFAQRNKIGLNCVLVLNETYNADAKGTGRYPNLIEPFRLTVIGYYSSTSYL